jgi:hypothetical protein
LEQKGNNLDEWIVVHERMFGTNHSILPRSEIHLSKLEGGLLNWWEIEILYSYDELDGSTTKMWCQCQGKVVAV